MTVLIVGAYRKLLRLYPASHRHQFREEMVAVFETMQVEAASKSTVAQGLFLAREASGVVAGAFQEHWRALGGNGMGLWFPTRRFTMRTEFRFPKTTAVLMTIILAGVMLAIKMGEAISVSVPPSSTPIGPIPATHSVLLGGIVFIFAFFYLAGMIGWLILFAMRRSGIHRLSETSGGAK
jgi:hypothetical protein